MENTNRRTFIKAAGLAGAAMALPEMVQAKEGTKDTNSILKNPLPIWRGFNFQNIYILNRGIKPPKEEHFKWIADWGFNFVRMPLTYRAWLKYKPKRGDKPITVDDVYQIDESTLELIDKAVEYGLKHGIHMCLCFHHAPGYKIGISDSLGEPFLLWRDKAAVNAFTFHWEMFAKRYKGVDKSKISFNLFNEAPWPNDNFNGEVYKNAITPAVQAIRKISPDRIIIADGAGAGNLSVPELFSLGINQSVHCYIPGNISHYKVDWMSDRTNWPEPKWPGALDDNGYTWDRKRLEEYYTPWKRLVDQGIGVHMGETSGSHRLPHNVFLAWLTDVLEICKSMGIGYALWDFIGESNFGILDSKRADVQYEDWHGHKLDRKMLTLLQKY
ncbi:MAG TPA: cellulase family glycosylhydrolase [Cytophagales bacterium]|nr:cellulase family glycosylhydrolase [Cytophagales bacterium]